MVNYNINFSIINENGEYLSDNVNVSDGNETISNVATLSNILSFAIATQIPALKPTFYQHLATDESFEMPYPHGSWYRNKDYIKYWKGAKVMAHVDHRGLHEKKDIIFDHISYANWD